MKLSKEEERSNNVTEYSENTLKTRYKTYKFPCLLSEKNNQEFTILTLKNIADLVKTLDIKDVELLVIGSAVRYSIKEQMIIRSVINAEFMNISAAIYSFNLMLSDYRRVALIIT